MVTPLPPGRYRIVAESEGFRRYILEPFPIVTQQKAGLDIELEIGEVTESITVAGTAQLIEATNSTLSGVVQNREITDLPLNGRNIYSLPVSSRGTRRAGSSAKASIRSASSKSTEGAIQAT